MRDVLCAAADRATIVTGDARAAPPCELIEPRGDTALADGLLTALRGEPEIVFVVSDGYENAPSGRMAEAVHAVRRLGIETPIYQLSPVFAAESASIRRLSEYVPALPTGTPEALGLVLLKATLQLDLERGVAALLRATLPALGEDDGSGTRIRSTHHVAQIER